MTRFLILTFGASFALMAAASAAEPSTTYYVQLVRGTDDDKSPQADAKPIGPNLSKRLEPIFRWKHYWQIKRVEVKVADGKSVKVPLSDSREAEIDLKTPGKRTVRCFRDGKLVSASTQPVGESFNIQGENAKAESAWFVVVRRAKPQELSDSKESPARKE